MFRTHCSKSNPFSDLCSVSVSVPVQSSCSYRHSFVIHKLTPVLPNGNDKLDQLLSCLRALQNLPFRSNTQSSGKCGDLQSILDVSSQKIGSPPFSSCSRRAHVAVRLVSLLMIGDSLQQRDGSLVGVCNEQQTLSFLPSCTRDLLSHLNARWRWRCVGTLYLTLLSEELRADLVGKRRRRLEEVPYMRTRDDLIDSRVEIDPQGDSTDPINGAPAKEETDRRARIDESCDSGIASPLAVFSKADLEDLVVDASEHSADSIR